jgi:hypothetical protein
MERSDYIDHLSDRGRQEAETASTVCRSIGFAAGVACWAFRDSRFLFPSIILSALICLCLFFLFDIAQYALSWRVSRQLFDLAIEEPPLPPKAMLAARRRLSRNLDRFFLSKLVVLFSAYILIGLEIVRRMASAS